MLLRRVALLRIALLRIALLLRMAGLLWVAGLWVALLWVAMLRIALLLGPRAFTAQIDGMLSTSRSETQKHAGEKSFVQPNRSRVARRTDGEAR